MSPALVVAAIALAVSGAGLLALCVRGGSILAAPLAAIATVLGGFAAVSGPGSDPGRTALLIALALLLLGAALHAFGQAFDRLLGHDSEESF